MEKNERFQKILDDIKSLTKMVEVLPCNESARLAGYRKKGVNMVWN